MIYSVIDDVEVNLQAEPFGAPISPVTKKSDEISAARSHQRKQESEILVVLGLSKVID